MWFVQDRRVRKSMAQRTQGPLSVMPTDGAFSFRGSEAGRHLPDQAMENEGLDSGLSGVDRFAISDAPEARLVAINEPGGVGAERLRTLGSRLKRAQQRYGIKKLLVTSAIPGEGKTLISANLAITLAMHRQRTLIIDGDLRGGSLGGLFNLETRAGLADWWEAKATPIKALYRAEQLPLWALPAGKYHDSPLSILQSSDFAELLAQFNEMFDWILIDAPPLIPFEDAATLANLSDAALLVTRQGFTPKKLLRKALQSIDGVKIVATVLNEATVSDHQYYQRYYQQASADVASGPRSRTTRLLPVEKK